MYSLSAWITQDNPFRSRIVVRCSLLGATTYCHRHEANLKFSLSSSNGRPDRMSESNLEGYAQSLYAHQWQELGKMSSGLTLWYLVVVRDSLDGACDLYLGCPKQGVIDSSCRARGY